MFVALLLLLSPGLALGVGPDLRARSRLLRDLPMGPQARKPSEDGSERQPRRTLIDMSLAVRSIDLNFDTGVFSTDGWMSLRWQDERYTWDPSDYEGIESVTLPFAKVWAPEVILHNSAQEKFIFRQVGLVKHDGEFVYMIAVHTKSGCEPNYAEFPFGMQSCRLVFGSWVNENYKVEYRANETVALDDFFSPTGWKVVATQARLESRQYPLFEEPSNTVVFDFAFNRDFYFDQVTKKMQRVRRD